MRDTDGPALTRARLIAGTTLLGSALLLGFAAPSGVWLGQTDVAICNAVSGTLFGITIVILRTTGAVTIAANYLLTLGWISMVGIYATSLGSNLSALYSMSILPLAAMLLGGTRVGFVWATITCASIYTIAYTSLGELSLPVTTAMETSHAALARDVILQTIWVTLFAGFYDALRNHATREARIAAGRAAQSEERFERVFATSPQALAIWNVEDDRLVECNQGFLAVVGLEREEVVGQIDWCTAIGVDSRQREAMLDAVSDARRVPEFEVTFPAPDESGNPVAREYLVTAALMEFDGKSCVLTTGHDVTLRKQLDRRLRQTQKMEAIGQMAGSIAHDFNNMLTVITGYSSQLMKELPGEEGEILGEIHTAAQRSAGLTRQLLAFSRRQVVQTEILDLNPLVENLDRMLEHLLGDDIELALELSPYATSVRADAGQLEQVIVNLAINARDAMPDGGKLTIAIVSGLAAPRLYASAPQRLSAHHGRWAAIRVSDTGVGMDEATLGRATEPFFTTKETGHGTGLGLATAHGIVGQSGGELVLESEPERGTTVTAFFPQLDEDAEAAIDLQEKDTGRAARAGPSRTVLLVEDEAMVRRIMKQTLERSGLEVVEAENGRHALEVARAREGEIAIVVSDIMMPEMGGPTLAARLAEEQPGLPILFMSGYPDTLETPAGRIPSDAEVIEKPFTPATLEVRVFEMLESIKSEDAS